MIGWVADLIRADAFFLTRTGAENLWPPLTDEEKTAALLTAYRGIKFSPLLSLPPTPTAGELEVLEYAQFELALHHISLGTGGILRAAGIAQGMKIADVVGEEYTEKKISTLPAAIMDILDSFNNRGAFFGSAPLYRNDCE